MYILVAPVLMYIFLALASTYSFVAVVLIYGFAIDLVYTSRHLARFDISIRSYDLGMACRTVDSMYVLVPVLIFRL